MTRYLDWAITTPVMLLVLCLVFVYNTKQQLSAKFFLLILVLNYAMLGLGYLGETQQISKNTGLIGGWVFFVILYGLLYITFLQNRNVFDNNIIFIAFVIFWSGYGLLYKTNEEIKNIGYNVLDLFSKCFVGIFFWAYLTKVLVIF
jgi:bacteriorhodopsin